MSREIDERVAREVMGMPKPDWMPTMDEVASAYLSSMGYEWKDWPWEIRYWGDEGDIFCWTAKRYSTDISAAWEVVGRFEDRTVTIVGGDGGKWACVVMVGDRHFSGSADTAPLAICLAALEAVK